jgi:selenocysteine lyase/cysteine desulfurase
MRLSSLPQSTRVSPVAFRPAVTHLTCPSANVGPWVKLAKQLNLTIKYWIPTPLPDSNSPFALALNVSDLEPLLSANTRLVAFTAVSNLLGHRTQVKDAVQLIKGKSGGRAMTVVDCVAYAPHGRMDMQAWGCDAVLFSFYKVGSAISPTERKEAS